MQKLASAAVLLFAATALSACATRPPIPAEAAARDFVVERDLVGASVARGQFRSITGANRTFTAELSGILVGDTLTLTEDFVFDDGEMDRKTWQLRRVSPGRYIGTREDVVGEAVGYQEGNVFRLEYDVILPSENGRGRKVRFRDVMAFDESGSVLNNATVGWFGFRVGSVSLVIERGAPQA